MRDNRKQMDASHLHSPLHHSKYSKSSQPHVQPNATGIDDILSKELESESKADSPTARKWVWISIGVAILAAVAIFAFVKLKPTPDTLCDKFPGTKQVGNDCVCIDNTSIKNQKCPSGKCGDNAKLRNTSDGQYLCACEDGYAGNAMGTNGQGCKPCSANSVPNATFPSNGDKYTYCVCKGGFSPNFPGDRGNNYNPVPEAPSYQLSYCSRNDQVCGGHGKVSSGKCICDFAWKGDKCNKPACVNGRPSILTGKCDCSSGHEGPQCDIPVPKGATNCGAQYNILNNDPESKLNCESKPHAKLCRWKGPYQYGICDSSSKAYTVLREGASEDYCMQSDHVPCGPSIDLQVNRDRVKAA